MRRTHDVARVAAGIGALIVAGIFFASCVLADALTAIDTIAPVELLP